ncbi:response regulator [Bizionia sediminis]|uniref:Response regulator n=1 Tax=Bizionia sediminis TaxID=1737064 RepID=A0ABW5KTA0_9FLAO
MTPKKDITLVIAEDHPLMLKGLHQELEQAGYTVLKTAQNGAEALEVIKLMEPKIALLDIEMPNINGFEVIAACQQEDRLPTRFIVMTYHKLKSFVAQAKKLEVPGYLLKEDSFKEIDQCIQAVMAGNTHYSSSLGNAFESSAEKELKKYNQLTKSERKIVQLIAEDKSSTEIADILYVSPRTVQKHRTNIIEKLQLDHGPDNLIKWAKEFKDLK